MGCGALDSTNELSDFSIGLCEPIFVLLLTMNNMLFCVNFC